PLHGYLDADAACGFRHRPAAGMGAHERGPLPARHDPATGVPDAPGRRAGQHMRRHDPGYGPVYARLLHSRDSGSAPHGQAPSPLRTITEMTATPAAAPLLEARGLSFRRQDEPVFAPLDFRLHAGELALIE